jgi:hypothetical protein
MTSHGLHHGSHPNLTPNSRPMKQSVSESYDNAQDQTGPLYRLSYPFSLGNPAGGRGAGQCFAPPLHAYVR